MVDTLKLEYKIKKAGKSNRDCADALGITYQAFMNKLNNRREFKFSEITALSDFIGVPLTDSIFLQKELN